MWNHAPTPAVLNPKGLTVRQLRVAVINAAFAVDMEAPKHCLVHLDKSFSPTEALTINFGNAIKTGDKREISVNLTFISKEADDRLGTTAQLLGRIEITVTKGASLFSTITKFTQGKELRDDIRYYCSAFFVSKKVDLRKPAQAIQLTAAHRLELGYPKKKPTIHVQDHRLADRLVAFLDSIVG